MIPRHNASIGMFGLLGLIGTGMLVRDNGLSTDTQPAQTEAALPPSTPLKVSRQVRRWEASHPHRVGETGTRFALNRSRYMPHNGKQEMARRVRQAAA